MRTYFQVSVVAALVTHHHWDHAGGMKDFKKLFPEATVYGGDSRIDELNHAVKHKEDFDVGDLKVCVFLFLRGSTFTSLEFWFV